MKLTLITGRHFHSFQSKFLPYACSATITDLNERFSDVTLDCTTHKNSTKSSAPFFIVKKKLSQSKTNKKGQNKTKQSQSCVKIVKLPIKNIYQYCFRSTRIIKSTKVNTVVSNHINSDHVPSFSCLDVSTP